MKESGIIAFAFGAPDNILSNRIISGIASKKARKLNSHIYTQLDVRIEDGVPTERIRERSGKPPSTLRFAREAVNWAEQEGIEKLWVVAAKPHLWRALRDVREAVREAGMFTKVLPCKEIGQYPEDSWFCQDSSQKRTRSSKAWDRRERILKCMPWFLYKLIAS